MRILQVCALSREECRQVMDDSRLVLGVNHDAREGR